MADDAEHLVQTGRLAALGALAAGMAHEINNPNSCISLHANRLKAVWADLLPLLDRLAAEEGGFLLGGLDYAQVRAEMPGVIDDLATCSRRIGEIAGDLLRFARPGGTDAPSEEVDLNRSVMAAVRLLAQPIRKATRDFRVDLQPLLPAVRGRAGRLEQVLVNLIANACQALAAPDANITVRTRAGDGRVAVEVVDRGRGIAPEVLGRLRQPFMTTRREQGGTGLGLWICDLIVAEHGGTLAIASRSGEGTTVTVDLPALV